MVYVNQGGRLLGVLMDTEVRLMVDQFRTFVLNVSGVSIYTANLHLHFG